MINKVLAIGLAVLVLSGLVYAADKMMAEAAANGKLADGASKQLKSKVGSSFCITGCDQN